MAWTSVGFDGTITEIQWAGMASLLGNDYVAAGNGDCLVTAVPGARSVSVAAGSLYGDGVLSTNSGAETVAMTTPVNGQWYVIALRRTWATNTAALVAIAGATTTTTTPTAPPTSFPTLNTNKGVLTDQPIAWAWCNSANTTVVVYDIRLQPVKSLPPVVATSAERDAKFMTPTQGMQVWRNDLGAVETYYGLYNSSTNPGGRDVAGWDTDTRQTGLIPIRPTTVTIVSGSGSTNALGQLTFSSATKVSLDGVFTSRYQNYRVVFGCNGSSANGSIQLRMRKNGAEYTGTQYNFGGLAMRDSGTQTAFVGSGNTGFSLSWMNGPATGSGSGSGTIEIFKPATDSYQSITSSFRGADNTSGAGIFTGGNVYAGQTQDGFSLYPSTGTFSGILTVYGYND